MSVLFESIINNGITATSFLVCLAAALLCGIICAFSASFKTQSSKGFLVSLIILPMIVSTVITMVNGNIGTGIAVMGAFSLVRFRSVPGKAKDIAAIFLSMTSGLACAGGYVLIAIIFTVIVCAVIVALSFIPFGDDGTLILRITIPESLNFSDAFDDLFKEYTTHHKLTQTKTSNVGSLFKLTYQIKLKDRAQMKEFIDKLRCRNGNLEISISENTEGSDEL